MQAESRTSTAAGRPGAKERPFGTGILCETGLLGKDQSRPKSAPTKPTVAVYCNLKYGEYSVVQRQRKPVLLFGLMFVQP